MDGTASPIAASPFLGVERSACGRRWRARPADEGAALLIAERLGLPEIVGRLLAQRGVGLAEAPSFSRRACASSSPTPPICATWRRLSPASFARSAAARRSSCSATTTWTARRRRRCCCAFSRRPAPAPRSMCPTGSAKATGRTRRRCCACGEEGAAVAVTVDCGATAHEPLAAAKEAGLDVIVVDHHVGEALLPRRRRGHQSEPARRDEPARRARRGRGRLPAGRRRQPRIARGRAGMASAPNPTCCNGSTWSRSAPSATSSR